MNSVSTLSTVMTKKILNTNGNCNSLVNPTNLINDPHEDLYVLKSTFADKIHESNLYLMLN